MSKLELKKLSAKIMSVGRNSRLSGQGGG